MSLLPLLIPVVVWAVLNRRDSQQRASKLVNQAAVGGASVSTKAGDGPSVVAVAGGGRAPRFHVGEFSSGGAIGRTAKSTLVKDVLLGEHECVLFAYIEELHGRALPWGDVLDAGTGSHSLGWALALDSSSVTAVTGDEAMLRDVQRDFSGKLRAADELVIGNWKNDDFLEGRQYDVLLADYLLGALVRRGQNAVHGEKRRLCLASLGHRRVERIGETSGDKEREKGSSGLALFPLSCPPSQRARCHTFQHLLMFVYCRTDSRLTFNTSCCRGSSVTFGPADGCSLSGRSRCLKSARRGRSSSFRTLLGLAMPPFCWGPTARGSTASILWM